MALIIPNQHSTAILISCSEYSSLPTNFRQFITSFCSVLLDTPMEFPNLTECSRFSKMFLLFQGQENQRIICSMACNLLAATWSNMVKDSKGRRKLEDWRRAHSCSRRTQRWIDYNRTEDQNWVCMVERELPLLILLCLLRPKSPPPLSLSPPLSLPLSPSLSPSSSLPLSLSLSLDLFISLLGKESKC